MQERNEAGLLPGLSYLPWVTAWQHGLLMLPHTPGTGMLSPLSTLLAGRKSCLLTDCRQGGRLVFISRLKSSIWSWAVKPVFIAQQVCYRPQQTTSKRIVTQSYSLADCREAWQCVVPMHLQRHFRHGDQMVVNELILAHMLGFSFPQVQLLLLNTVSLQLLG